MRCSVRGNLERRTALCRASSPSRKSSLTCRPTFANAWARAPLSGSSSALCATSTTTRRRHRETRPRRHACHGFVWGPLTYSYAIGLYGSDAIAAQIPEDPNLGCLAGKTTPSANDLRRFRRAHRVLLKRSLTFLLQLACHARKEPASCLPSPNDSQLAFLCESAAERRINEAVFTDSMALDF